MFPRFLLSLLPVGLSLLDSEARAAVPDIGGEYNGVIQGDSFETSGRFRMVLGRAGRGSVSVCVGDEPPCVIRAIYDPGDGSIAPGGSGDADMALHLRIVFNLDGFPVVTGTVDDEDETFTIEATRAVKKSESAIGAHTFVLGASEGTADAGFGYAKVKANGKVAGVLQIGQHRATSFGGRLTPEGNLPVAIRFEKTDASFVGDLSFADFSTGGTFAQYSAATSVPVHFWRTPYHPRRQPLVGTDGAFNLATTIGGVASGTAIQLNSGAIVNATLSGAPAKLKVVRGTGFVTGGTKTSALHGVVMQDSDVLTGLCNSLAEFSIESTGPATIESHHTSGSSSGSLSKEGSGNLTLAGGSVYVGSSTGSYGAIVISWAGRDLLTAEQLQLLNSSFINRADQAALGALMNRAPGDSSGYLRRSRESSDTGSSDAPPVPVLVGGGSLPSSNPTNPVSVVPDSPADLSDTSPVFPVSPSGIPVAAPLPEGYVTVITEPRNLPTGILNFQPYNVISAPNWVTISGGSIDLTNIAFNQTVLNGGPLNVGGSLNLSGGTLTLSGGNLRLGSIGSGFSGIVMTATYPGIVITNPPILVPPPAATEPADTTP